jgi:chemotaxis protein CheD
VGHRLDSKVRAEGVPAQTSHGMATRGSSLLQFQVLCSTLYFTGDEVARNCDRNQKVIDIQTGQVKAGRGKVILQSRAIGSCIAIVAYDATKNVGALAHIMLPGRAPARKEFEKTKYAADAIDAILNKMTVLDSKKDDIEVFLIGGGNVLNREDDTICKDNIESVLKLLSEKQLKVRAQAVGGTARRSVSLDVEHGIVSYAEGDGGEKQLWRS